MWIDWSRITLVRRLLRLVLRTWLRILRILIHKVWSIVWSSISIVQNIRC